MADETREILIDVQVDARDFDQEIGDVNTQLKKNREEIKELSKDYENNAKEIAKLEQQNKNLSESKRDLVKQNKTESNSLNGLRLKLAALTKERNNLDTSIAGNSQRFKELQKEIKGTSDEIKIIEQGGGDFRRNVGNYKSAINGLGLAFKALGIGLILKLLDKLVEALGRNEKLVKLFETAVAGVQIVLDDLISFLVDNVGSVISVFKEIFDNPVESIKAFGQAILDNIIERFNSLIEFSGLVGTAIKQLFAGDFAGALDTAGEAAKEYVDILTGVDNAVDKISEGVTSGIEVIRNYGKSVLDAAETLVQASNDFESSLLRQEGITLRFLKLQEDLRQSRDDENLSIQERLKANDALIESLERQEELEKEEANRRLLAAELRASTFKDDAEAQNLLLEAQNAILEIEERINGQRSEALTNRVALEKEANEKFLEFQDNIAQGVKDEADRDNALRNLKIKNQSLVSDSIKGIFGEQSKIGKAFALAQIAADTGRALTGALANSQSPTPDNILTGGIAGIAKYVALAATIASNARSAINIVKSGNASSISSASSGGGSSTVGSSAGQGFTQPTLIQPQLLSQFSQPVQNQQDLVNAASSQQTVNSVVSVVDIKKGLESNVTKVEDSSL